MEYFQNGGGAQFDEFPLSQLEQKRREIIEQLAALAYIRPVDVQDMVLSADRAALVAGYLVVINYGLGQRGFNFFPVPDNTWSPVLYAREDAGLPDGDKTVVAAVEPAPEKVAAAKEMLNEHVHRAITGEKSTVKLTWAIHPHPGGENWHVALVDDRKYIVKQVGAHEMWRAVCWIGKECVWAGEELMTVWKARRAAQEHFAGCKMVDSWLMQEYREYTDRRLVHGIQVDERLYKESEAAIGSVPVDELDHEFEAMATIQRRILMRKRALAERVKVRA